jgi:hypothetical protein
VKQASALSSLRALHAGQIIEGRFGVAHCVPETSLPLLQGVLRRTPRTPPLTAGE